MSIISAVNTIQITNTTYSINGGASQSLPTFPISIINISPSYNSLRVLFSSEITYSSNSNYFICGSDNIIFDGQNNPISVTATDWLGLIQNGIFDVSGKNNIFVQNIGITASGDYSIAPQAGWVCHKYFYYGSSNGSIMNCYSSGDISNNYSGGICGAYFAKYSSNCSITNCYSSGIIGGNNSGGICGGDSNGTITFCYSIGDIIGPDAGGICGVNTGSENGITTIKNCYSIGNISGYYSGGICGSGAGNNNGQLIIQNCYSMGNTFDYTAGICYSIGITNPGSVNIINSYSYNGIIIDPELTGYILTNCYTANGNWFDLSANIFLTDTPDENKNMGTVWTSLYPRTPFVLSQFNFIKTYTPDTITINSPKSTIYTSFPGIFTYDYTYLIVNIISTADTTIQINSSSGEITFSNLNLYNDVTYIVNIYYSKNNNTRFYYGYNFNKYTFNLYGIRCICTIPPAIPLSKKTKGISCKMRYAEVIKTFGTTQTSTSYVKKTCSLGGPTFSY